MHHPGRYFRLLPFLTLAPGPRVRFLVCFVTCAPCGGDQYLDRQVEGSLRGLQVLEFLLRFATGANVLARLVKSEFHLDYLGCHHVL